MATWRRKDLKRRSGDRGRRIGRILRAEVLIPVLALLVSGVALWQAMAAQSRAEVLAHDLVLADNQLRSLGGYAPAAPAIRAPNGEAGSGASALASLLPVGLAPAGAPSGSTR